MNSQKHGVKWLRCPSCRGQLANGKCEKCGRSYRATLGILDLRWPRPTTTETQTPLVSEILTRYPSSTFKEMAELQFVDSRVPERLLSVYRQYRANLEERGRNMMRMFRQRLSTHYSLPGQRLALDIGCGVGAGLTVLAREFRWVIGLDPFLPNLLLARKRFEEQGVDNVILVQAFAQHIPLCDNCVDYTVAQNVIEHLFDVEPVFRELHRILRQKGCFCGDSRNRFDLFCLEPHAQLRWVGFLPRRLQNWYVRKLRKISYSSTHLLSLCELQHLARLAFGKSAQVTFPSISAYGRSPGWDRLIELVESIPLIRTALLAVFPSHLLLAQVD